MSQNSCDQAVRALIQTLASSPAGLSIIRSELEANGLSLFQRIEKTKFPEVTDLQRRHSAREGILLDTETTGVDEDGKLIQLAMLKIKYDDSGILSVGDEFSMLRDPGLPIPPEATKVNGITDAMVRGKAIKDDDVRIFIGAANKVFCHNAEFDRKVVERELPSAGFETLEFECSLNQIDWKARGMANSVLEFLALKSGYLYDAHNALSDIKVMPFLLGQKDTAPITPFEEMLAWSKLGSFLLVAKGAPFDKKDLLKKWGYKWSADGLATGGVKAWYRMLAMTVSRRSEEAAFLKNEIYEAGGVALPAFVIEGRNRYSTRQLSQEFVFDLDREAFNPDDPSFHESFEIAREEAAMAERDNSPGPNDW